MSDYHVVQHRREIDGKLVTVTHSVYQDNEPFLKPPRGKKLTRRQANGIANFLQFLPTR